MHGRSRGRGTRRNRVAAAVAAAAFALVAAGGCGGSGSADDLVGAGQGDSTADAAGNGDAAGPGKGAATSRPTTTPAGGGSKAPVLPTGTRPTAFPSAPNPGAAPTTVTAEPDRGSVSEVPGVVAYTFSQEHVSGPVVYELIPPAGGAHDQIWANCGVYREEVPDRNAVHSLEHGAVWVTYRPDLPEDQVARLETQLRGQPYVILSPYAGLPSPVVASAWGRQLPLDRADDPRLPRFVVEYANGPQTPERGASCSGGVGRPVY
jgi:hypothetical protein